jgi:AcrR family transcriptional regulator
MARPADPHARSALVAAARAEFVKSGIQKARIEDITAACGLSKGAFYLHFDSKEALFGEVVAELQRALDQTRRSRSEAFRALTRASKGRAFLERMAEFDAREDRRLLELLWAWRDVTAVLMRGAQGTEFDGVFWDVLDFELGRIDAECAQLKHAGVVRGDVSGEVLGMMVVGTYLLVARRFAMARVKPDFEALVLMLQQTISRGIAPPARGARVAPTRLRARPAARVLSTKNGSRR